MLFGEQNFAFPLQSEHDRTGQVHSDRSFPYTLAELASWIFILLPLSKEN